MAGAAIETAAEQAELSVIELVDALVRDTPRLLLLAAALEGAAMSSANDKMLLFAKSLANGALATDDSLIDDERFYVAAFRELDVPHFRVLAHMVAGKSELHPGCASRDGLIRVYPQAALIIDSLLGILQRNSLIRVANAAELVQPARASLASTVAKAINDALKPGHDDIAETYELFLDAQRNFTSPTYWVVTAFGAACFERAQLTWAPRRDRPTFESNLQR